VRIFIEAKPNAKQNKVEKIDKAHFKVSVTSPPVNGKANEAIIRVLAEYFNVSPSHINIVSGHTNRRKVAEIKNI